VHHCQRHLTKALHGASSPFISSLSTSPTTMSSPSTSLTTYSGAIVNSSALESSPFQIFMLNGDSCMALVPSLLCSMNNHQSQLDHELLKGDVECCLPSKKLCIEGELQQLGDCSGTAFRWSEVPSEEACSDPPSLESAGWIADPNSAAVDSIYPIEEACSDPPSLESAGWIADPNSAAVDSIDPIEEACSDPPSLESAGQITDHNSAAVDIIDPIEEACSDPPSLESAGQIVDHNSAAVESIDPIDETHHFEPPSLESGGSIENHSSTNLNSNGPIDEKACSAPTSLDFAHPINDSTSVNLECRGALDSDSCSDPPSHHIAVNEEVIGPVDEPALSHPLSSKSANASSMSFNIEHSNSHTFLLVDIPPDILESIYSTVVQYPLTSYHVIWPALKQMWFYKAFHMLFPSMDNKWQELVQVLKQQFLKYHSHTDMTEVNVTVLITDGPMVKEQQPHMDYSWETILLPNQRESKQIHSKYLRASCQIPFTGHMPVTTDGAFIYLWNGPGIGTLYHIKYGQILLIHGDVIQCGGLPSFASSDKLYHRIHFYLPCLPSDIPKNSIYLNNFDGQSFTRDYLLH
jgi:hypothetical protein